MQIFCIECEKHISAALINGKDVYPHRADLASIPFWRCTSCFNFVGCHHKTKDKTRPLGDIAPQAVKQIRSEVHKMLDPMWRSGRYERKELYRLIASELGIKSYHTANVRTVDDGHLVISILNEIAKGK